MSWFIHIAMETSGCVPQDIIQKIAPHVDLFLYDLKHIDPVEHKRYCGMGNAGILENLQTLSGMGKQIIIRMVVVPGVNDAPETVESLCAFLKEVEGIRSISLLPLHKSATQKHNRLDKKFLIADFRVPDDEKMEGYKHYLSICNSAPSERLAIIALKAKEKILERNRNLVNRNAQKLDVFSNEFPELFEWYRPDGGCVGYPKYKGTKDTNRFCEDLVDKTGILLLPPKIYHSELLKTPQDRFRIGFGRKNMDKGLSVFHAYLSCP